MELGETVASWVEFPNGWYLHSDDADAEFTQDGAKTYLQRLNSVWMESPFWDSVKAILAKHGISDADLDRMAAPYEDGSFEPEPDGKVFSGSHLDAVGTRRVTVVEEKPQ